MNLHADCYTKKDIRFRTTVKLLDKYGPPVHPILNIGDANLFLDDLEYEYGDCVTTYGNLNGDRWRPRKELKYDTVFCFEIIEHLMSPWMMLDRLIYWINKDTDVFITYPRRIELFWTDHHFHEYSRKRFLHMIDDCGYKVINYEWHWFPVWSFKGIRPILRLTPLGMIRNQFYKLRLK